MMRNPLATQFFFRRSLVCWVVCMTTAAGLGKVDLDGFGWGQSFSSSWADTSEKKST